MNQELRDFMDHALSRGMDYAGLRLLLLSSGWKEKEISEAFAEMALDRPVPEPKVAGSARDAFFQLLGFTSLYTWVISLILLIFRFVDLGFPDPAEQTSYWTIEYIYSGIRASLATLVVSFPFFMVVWTRLVRELDRHPEKAKGALWRWLTYATLFVGWITLFSDVTTLVYFFFEGELTTRFVLKGLALLVITGVVISYLSLTLKSGKERKS